METSAAGELDIVGAVVSVTTPADAIVVAAVVTEGSAGREGAGLESFMGMKMFEAKCSLRYSPPFSSYSCLLIHPSAAAPLPVGRCSTAQSRAPYQASRAGRDASATWKGNSHKFKCFSSQLTLFLLDLYLM